MHTISGERGQYSRWIAPFRRVDGGFVSVLDLVLAWSERSRQRAALQRLDDRMLRDVGLTRAEVGRECEKPFWRP
jgi:uncharacterized protein YjiS (DUF1127 family)